MMKRGLGKGIDALISASGDIQVTNAPEIDIDLIEPNKRQPRSEFDQDELEELAESIRTVGIIQPLVLRKEEGYYTIIAGERRYRAARMAGLRFVPAITRESDESETLALALIENLQRVDLNPMEEAISYKRLADEFGLTQEEIAARIGKSRSSVANTLRYVNLPEAAKDLLRSGKITSGHAKALLGLEDIEEINQLAQETAESQLSVRALEELVKNRLLQTDELINKTEKTKDTQTESIYKSLERELDSALGTKIKIKANKDGAKGRIEIEFFSKEELDRLYLLLRNIKERNNV